MADSLPFTPAQQSRREQFRCARVVDVHCHILPGIDDGPPNEAEALALARMLVGEGVTDVIATPHMLGRWDGVNKPADVRQAVANFQPRLHESGIALTLHSGGEVRLDERIPALLKGDGVMTLAERGYLLLELPSMLVVDPKALGEYLKRAGVKIILAHAERYDLLNKAPDLAQVWIEQGMALQVNATSLLGGSGERAELAAWHWIERGWVSLLASDAHSISSRRPRLTEAIDALLDRAGHEFARRICIENPLRVLEGRELA